MTTPAPADYLAPGSRLLDRFTVLREIGRGGFSIVYAARDDRVGADIALKLLVPPPAVAQQARERMRREVRAVRGLAHRHIVQVHDFVEDGPRSFIVMELINGPDLAVRMKDRGPLRPEEAARIGAAIAEALHLAHSRGILHRDVKPSNILLDGGRACLTDFGSAKLQGSVSMTQTGGVPGTVDYLAPELLGGARADARADIYALGLTLHVAATGQLPKRPSSLVPPPALAEGHRPSVVRPDLPPWFDAIVARATAARPSDRFASAELLAEALIARDAAVLPAFRSRAMTTARCASCAAEEAGPGGLCAACLLARRWVPMPASLYAVSAGMVVAGAAAASVVPPLLVASPVLAGLLLLEGQRSVRGRSRLPRRARQRVARAVAALRPGAARRLLVDVAAASEALVPSYRRVAGSRTAADLTAFLQHACDVAQELAEIDELLATLEQGREDLAAAADTWNDAVAVTEQRRDTLVQQLLGTVARLARMAQVSARDASSVGQLEEMGSGLETAIREHAEAMREVEEVLKPLRA